MAWKVTWTESAWIDLEEIADYIGKDSPHYAGVLKAICLHQQITPTQKQHP
jgi:hypothetical protein